MASYSDQQLLAAVQPQLQPGENVVSVAFGAKPMNTGLQIVLTLVMLGTGILPGLILFLIVNASVHKNYVVALTNMRLIVNEVSGSLQRKTSMDFPVPIQGRIVGALNGNFIEFAIFAQRSVDMKFFRNNGPTNYNNAQMIVQSLQQGQMGGPMGAGQPGGYGQPQMGGGAPGGQLPPAGGGGYGAPPGGGGYGPPQGGGAPPGGGGYGPPQGGGYGPPQGGGYGPPPGGGGGAPPGGGYGPPGGGGGAPPGGGYGPPGGAPPQGGGYGPPGGGGGYGPPGGGYGPS